MKDRIQKFVTIAVVVGLSAVGADANAGQECERGWLCDSEGAFKVKVPTTFYAVPKAELPSDVAAHLLSNNSLKTGGNCPIVSATDPAWKLLPEKTKMKEIRDIIDWDSFWREVFTLANFQVVRLTIIDKRSADRQKIPFDDDSQLALVDVVFRMNKNGPLLRAKQALYMLPKKYVSRNRPEDPGPGVGNYVPPRYYFVNCTARESEFSSERTSFMEVFETFQPQFCHYDIERKQYACDEQLVALIEQPLPTGATTKASLEAIAARTAAVGAE